MPARNAVSDKAGQVTFTRIELLISVIARLLGGCRHIAVGAASPIPGAAALLARALSNNAMRVSIINSPRHNSFSDGGVELFDLAAQGRIDAFFLGGGQIDGHGNVNLVGTGTYPNVDVRWPGSFGSAYLYFLVPRVILFREEHTRRVMVPKVDFISAPGSSEPGVYRPGGPVALVTNLAQFAFDRTRRGFYLESVHPGHSIEEVLDNTGFNFDRGDSIRTTPAPEAEVLRLLRDQVFEEVAQLYPRFATSLASEAAPAS